jgi:hypothetical protein
VDARSAVTTRRAFVFGASAAAAAAIAQERPDEGLPDFSNCGYRDGGVALPDIQTRATLKPEAGDATARIQAAIDKLDRGAVLLAKGEYEVAGTLRIHSSGIVLRGEEGTKILGVGTKPRALIEIRGRNAGAPVGSPVRIADELVPVGARSFRIARPGVFRVGQLVLVRRIGNAAWIHEIGMDRIKGRPGVENTTRQWQPFNLDFERTVTGVDGDRLTIDAPVFCAIEERWGGGEIIAFDDSGRIRESGVENLRGISSFDKSVTALYGREKEKYLSDEKHASDMVAIEAANDCWVRGVSALHFSFACVNVGRTRHITVEDCDCREMVSEITGSRRYCFSVNGQRTLVQRCTGDTGRHDFVVGARVAGPNVFHDCKAGRSFATSEPHHRWSVGGLYDNVKANIAFQDRQYMGTGHGWSGANYVAWNCEGSLVCQKPPTANNWAIGQIGKKEPGAFAPREDGTWRSVGKHVSPRSLYLAQLEARRKYAASGF